PECSVGSLSRFRKGRFGKPPVGGLNRADLSRKRKLHREHAQENKKLAEIPRAQLQAGRPSLQQIFGKRSKNGIEAAYTKYGYRMREIAEHLGVHYATVSRRLIKLEQEKGRV